MDETLFVDDEAAFDAAFGFVGDDAECNSGVAAEGNSVIYKEWGDPPPCPAKNAAAALVASAAAGGGGAGQDDLYLDDCALPL